MPFEIESSEKYVSQANSNSAQSKDYQQSVVEVKPPDPKSNEEVEKLVQQATSFSNNVVPLGAKKSDRVNMQIAEIMT